MKYLSFLRCEEKMMRNKNIQHISIVHYITIIQFWLKRKPVQGSISNAETKMMKPSEWVGEKQY